MTYREFLDLYQYACASEDYNEFLHYAQDIGVCDEELLSTGILYSVWLYCEDQSCNKIRELTGMSRAKFSREYGIPVRTVENWELKRTYPSDWTLNLLAYAVMQEIHQAPKANQDLEPEEEG